MATRTIFARTLSRARPLAVARSRTPAVVPALAITATSTGAPSSKYPPRQPRVPTGARSFSAAPARRHGHVKPPEPGQELWVTFIDKDNQEHKIAVRKGDNLLDIAQEHELEMEGMRFSLYPPSLFGRLGASFAGDGPKKTRKKTLVVN